MGEDFFSQGCVFGSEKVRENGKNNQKIFKFNQKVREFWANQVKVRKIESQNKKCFLHGKYKNSSFCTYFLKTNSTLTVNIGENCNISFISMQF